MTKNENTSTTYLGMRTLVDELSRVIKPSHLDRIHPTAHVVCFIALRAALTALRRGAQQKAVTEAPQLRSLKYATEGMLADAVSMLRKDPVARRWLGEVLAPMIRASRRTSFTRRELAVIRDALHKLDPLEDVHGQILGRVDWPSLGMSERDVSVLARKLIGT